MKYLFIYLAIFQEVLLIKEFDFWQVKLEILLYMQVMLSSSKQFGRKVQTVTRAKLTVIYNKEPRIAIESQLPQGNTDYALKTKHLFWNWYKFNLSLCAPLPWRKKLCSWRGSWPLPCCTPYINLRKTYNICLWIPNICTLE